jgi:hypothetical protein
MAAARRWMTRREYPGVDPFGGRTLTRPERGELGVDLWRIRLDEIEQLTCSLAVLV